MREAAADLEFETAARLRDEIKRLRETELAVADDPLARQADVEERAGAFAGERKYGKAPAASPSPRSSRGEGRGEGQRHTPLSASGAAPHPNPLPASGERGQVAQAERGSTSRIQREYQPVQPTYAQSTTIPTGTRARKPTLDEMGPHAERGVPASPSPGPVPASGERESGLRKKHRHGRARKTGRPGQ